MKNTPHQKQCIERKLTKMAVSAGEAVARTPPSGHQAKLVTGA